MTHYVSNLPKSNAYHIAVKKLGDGERLLCGRRMWQGYGWTTDRRMLRGKKLCKSCSTAAKEVVK